MSTARPAVSTCGAVQIEHLLVFPLQSAERQLISAVLANQGPAKKGRRIALVAALAPTSERALASCFREFPPGGPPQVQRYDRQSGIKKDFLAPRRSAEQTELEKGGGDVRYSQKPFSGTRGFKSRPVEPSRQPERVLRRER